MSSPWILASASPRRRELLERVGLRFEVVAADIDESVREGEEARPYAQRVSAEKARTIATARPGTWVLAADTVVEIDGLALGKAADAEEARTMLRRLSARVHRVTTAVTLCRDEQNEAIAVTTEVQMRPLGGKEIDAYVAASEWQGKAGAYAIQGMAAAFVTEIRGSVTNVIGLPLAEVVGLLRRHEVAEVDFLAGDPA